MSTPTAPDPNDTTIAVATDQPTTAATPSPAAGSPDPITGEPGAHPVGVGVGALSAGAAGAAIGSIGGPIGVLIGAAIGAVAGGLAGKEIAASPETAAVSDETARAAGEPPLVLPVDAPTPITMASVPDEGFRASSGSGIAGDASTLTAGTSGWLPVSADAGLQAPVVPEGTPLAGEAMPHSGEEAVQVAAYYIYLDRANAGQPGDAMGDWLEAERAMMLS